MTEMCDIRVVQTAPRTDAAIANRAGAALELNYPGLSKDKRIARALLISPTMAGELRAGRGWTVARLDQAIRLLPGFRDLVFPPTGIEFALLRDEIRSLREDIEKLRRDLATERNPAQTPIGGKP